MSLTSGASHFAQVALTAMPHFSHLYVAIIVPSDREVVTEDHRKNTRGYP
jgi:hypothetical protein